MLTTKESRRLRRAVRRYGKAVTLAAFSRGYDEASTQRGVTAARFRDAVHARDALIRILNELTET